jgi:hypothetical protein
MDYPSYRGCYGNCSAQSEGAERDKFALEQQGIINQLRAANVVCRP